MTSDIPNLSENELDRAKEYIDRENDKPCPNKDGRVHRAYFYAHLDGRYDAHFCQTCGKEFTVKREA